MEDKDDRKPPAKRSFEEMEDEDDHKPPAKRSFEAMDDEDDCKPSAKRCFDTKKGDPNIITRKKTRQEKYNKRFSQKKKKK